MKQSPFSEKLPKLQLAWDSTSLKALMFCPKRYEYEIIRGYRGSSIDLEFGILAQLGFERYEKGRLAGETKAEARLAAVRLVMEESGHYVERECAVGGEKFTTWVPWGGQYVEQWRCTGTEPYRNKKGNRAKCPYSHKGKWFITPQPSTCGECGSETESERRYMPDDPAKNRQTLVRMLIWYIEEQPEELDAGLKPYAFPDGTPAIELSVRVPLPFQTTDGEGYLLCGHMDSIKEFGAEKFVADHKTTKKALSKAYFAGYNPDAQIDTYDMIGNLLYPDLKLKGVLIEAAQCMVGGNRFGIHPCYRTDEQREEFLADLKFWLDQAERFAKADHWPRNRASCWLCPFKGVCSATPERRQQILDDEFEKKLWNPLEER